VLRGQLVEIKYFWLGNGCFASGGKRCIAFWKGASHAALAEGGGFIAAAPVLIGEVVARDGMKPGVPMVRGREAGGESGCLALDHLWIGFPGAFLNVLERVVEVVVAVVGLRKKTPHGRGGCVPPLDK